MVKINIPSDRIMARVYSSPEERAIVKEILSYEEKVFIGKKKILICDGEYRTISGFQKVKRSVLKGNLFLAGLVPKVKSGLLKKGISPEIVFEEPKELFYEKPKLRGIQLRDYQLDVVKKVIQKRRGLIVFPTGSGKTVMMGAVIKAYPKLNFLVIVQKLDLMEQTIYNLRNMLFEDVGCVSGKEERWSSVTVGTIQTLLNRSFGFPWGGGLIVDEVHHAGSPSYREVLGRIGSEVRIGFTATEAYIPSKKLQIEGLFGPVIATMPYEELAEDGLLAQGTVLIYDTPVDINVYAMSSSNWNTLYEAGIMHNMPRNARIALLANDLVNGGKKVLVIVNRIEHGHLLRSLMGSDTHFVFGGTEMEDRGKVVKLLRQSGGCVVIATNIFDEGMDFPELDVVLMARGWRSPIATIQSAGRGTRVSGDKKSFMVIDFYDRAHRVLKQHSNARIKSYKSKNWNVIMKKDIQEIGLSLSGSTV